ncbi:MAG: hypothetical protein DRZ76_01395 [Candidatus Nealsonbacteria bacterium]|nr:MAG: hypothetical protein DRZ76_01395 [Candidatus Nealsonbacteria bacterium]
MDLLASEILQKYGTSGWSALTEASGSVLARIVGNIGFGSTPTSFSLDFVEKNIPVSGITSHAQIYCNTDILLNKLNVNDTIKITMPYGITSSGTLLIDNTETSGLVFVGAVVNKDISISTKGVLTSIRVEDKRNDFLGQARIWTEEFVSASGTNYCFSIPAWFRNPDRNSYEPNSRYPETEYYHGLRPDDNITLSRAETNKQAYEDILERGASYKEIWKALEYFFNNNPAISGDMHLYDMIPPPVDNASGIPPSSIRIPFNGESLLNVVTRFAEATGRTPYWKSNVPDGFGYSDSGTSPSGQMNVILTSSYKHLEPSGIIKYLEDSYGYTALQSRLGEAKDKNPTRVILWGGRKRELLKHVPLEPVWDKIPVRYQDYNGEFQSYIPRHEEYMCALQGFERWLDYCIRVEPYLYGSLPPGKTDLTTYTYPDGSLVKNSFSSIMDNWSSISLIEDIALNRLYGRPIKDNSAYTLLGEHHSYEEWTKDWFKRVETNANMYFGKAWVHKNFANYQTSVDLINSTGTFRWAPPEPGTEEWNEYIEDINNGVIPYYTPPPNSFTYDILWQLNYYERKIEISDSAWMDGLTDNMYYNPYRNQIQIRPVSGTSGILYQHVTPFINSNLTVRPHMVLRDSFLGYYYGPFFQEDFSYDYNTYKKRFVYGREGNSVPAGFTEYYEGNDPYTWSTMELLGISDPNEANIITISAQLSFSEQEPVLSAEYELGAVSNYEEMFPKGTLFVKTPTLIGIKRYDYKLKTLSENWKQAFNEPDWSENNSSFDSGVDVYIPKFFEYYTPPDSNVLSYNSPEILANVPVLLEERYGPWIVGSGDYMNTVVVTDDSIVPWNFVTFPSGETDEFIQLEDPVEIMNTWASGYAESLITGAGNKTVFSSTFAGFPKVGADNTDLFPLTDLSCEVSHGGVTTTYSYAENIPRIVLQKPKPKDLHGLEIGRKPYFRPYKEFDDIAGFDFPRNYSQPVIYDMRPAKGIPGKTAVTFIGENLVDPLAPNSYAVFSSNESASGVVAVLGVPSSGTWTHPTINRTVNTQEVTTIVPYKTVTGPVYITKVETLGGYSMENLGSGVLANSTELRSNPISFKVPDIHISDTTGGPTAACYYGGEDKTYPATGD